MALSNILTKLKVIVTNIACTNDQQQKYPCRILKIIEVADSNFIATVQVTGKRAIYEMRPDEILADDSLTQQFSPLDVRTLTYLGYLSINNPKYSILAKKLSNSDNRIIFLIRDSKTQKTYHKYANEVPFNEHSIFMFNQLDAHTLGYTAATEHYAQEKEQIIKFKQEISKKSNIGNP